MVGMKDSETIYILLPVHNRIGLSRQFAACLLKQTYHNYHLILIDDGSTDGTSQMMKELIPDCEVVRGKGDWWWGGSLQQGYQRLRKVTEGYVLICNDDTLFEKDFLERGIERIKQIPDVFLLAAPHNHLTGKLIDKGVYFDFKKNKMHLAENSSQIDFMSTRGLFCSVKSFLTTGGFRSFLLPHYYSDYEFTHRAKKKGFRLVCDESLKISSVESATGPKDISQASGRWSFVKQMFSKRYDYNPFYTANFILLTFPFPYNFKHAFLTYMRAFKRIVKFAVRK